MWLCWLLCMFINYTYLLTFTCTNLTEAVLERQCLNAQHFHLLHLLLIEELHLVHGDDAVTVQVHAAEPVLNTTQPDTTATACTTEKYDQNTNTVGLNSRMTMAGLTRLHICDDVIHLSDWLTDWVKVLHPTWHKTGHFRYVLPRQSLFLTQQKQTP